MVLAKISFMEVFIIVLGILWLLGIFRGFVIPVKVKHEVIIKNQPDLSTAGPVKVETPNLQPETRNPKQKTVSSAKYGLNDAEDIDFEEIN